MQPLAVFHAAPELHALCMIKGGFDVFLSTCCVVALSALFATISYIMHLYWGLVLKVQVSVTVTLLMNKEDS